MPVNKKNGKNFFSDGCFTLVQLAVCERHLEFFVGLLVERFSHPVKRLNDVEQV
jgi:hypothetical protein